MCSPDRDDLAAVETEFVAQLVVLPFLERDRFVIPEPRSVARVGTGEDDTGSQRPYRDSARAETRTWTLFAVARQTLAGVPSGRGGATSRVRRTVSGGGSSMMVSGAGRSMSDGFCRSRASLGFNATDARRPNLGLRN